MGFSMIEKLSKKLAELREQDKGMSLIELVVVVAILAVLVAIAIPAYLGVVDDAQRSAVQSQLQNAYTVYSYQIARGDSETAALGAARALSTADITVTGDATCLEADFGPGAAFPHHVILATGAISTGPCS